MPDVTAPFSPVRTAKRPLLGITILLVEDSRFCSEAVRMMAMRSGARLRRADTLKAARRHLQMYRPDVVLVDIGLPDGSGLELIAELSANPIQGQPLAVIALSGDTDAATQNASYTAGACGFLAKPVACLEQFQSLIETHIDGDGPAIRAVASRVTPLPLDQQALVDDLDRVRGLLEVALPKQDQVQVRYCVQFVASLAETAGDADLQTGAKTFFERIADGRAGTRSASDVLEIVQHRLKTKTDWLAQSVA